MNKILIVILFFNTLYAWEGSSLNFEEDINCNYFKSYSINEDSNPALIKCNIYKTTFDTYKPFVKHYNLKNKLGDKYSLKFHNIYAEYIFKKYIFDNLNKTKHPINSPLYNKYKWEADSLKIVYDKIIINEPYIVSDYNSRLTDWKFNGEGSKLSDTELLELHDTIVKLAKKALKAKYQFEINGTYTLLTFIEAELNKRNLVFNSVNTFFEF